MKATIHPSRLFALFAVVLSLAFAGCSVTGAASKFKEFEALGITEAEITGKFSSTSYRVETKDGQRTAELNHTNAWLPKVRLVRTSHAP